MTPEDWEFFDVVIEMRIAAPDKEEARKFIEELFNELLEEDDVVKVTIEGPWL